MDITRANYKKTEKFFNNLRDYIEEKFYDMNNKQDELKATLSNDTFEKFKEILKEELESIWKSNQKSPIQTQTELIGLASHTLTRSRG